MIGDLLFGLLSIGGILFVALAIFGAISRLAFMQKTKTLCNVSDDHSWKVWRLSAIEPAVTTLIGGVWLFWLLRSNSPDWIFGHSTHFVIQMSILLFVALVWKVGEGCRRGRLVISMLFFRLIILSTPLFFRLFITDPYNDQFFIASIGSIAVAYAIRAIFGLYQNKVTPKPADFMREQTEAQINLGRREIEDGITLTDDVDLWNEQVALIERLKAEITVS